MLEDTGCLPTHILSSNVSMKTQNVDIDEFSYQRHIRDTQLHTEKTCKILNYILLHFKTSTFKIRKQ